MEYPSSTLTAAQEGAHFDTRFRIALQLAASLGFAAVAAETIAKTEAVPPDAFAKFALDTANALVQQAQARGWVEPLTGLNGELPEHELDHIRRNARAQAFSQVHGQEVLGELAPSVGVVRRGGFGPQ